MLIGWYLLMNECMQYGAVDMKYDALIDLFCLLEELTWIVVGHHFNARSPRDIVYV